MATDGRRRRPQASKTAPGARGGRQALRIHEVRHDNRRRVFVVTTASGQHVFPYSQVRPPLTASARVRSVRVDPDLGLEGFTFALQGGDEGSVHAEAVLEYDDDPDALGRALLYRLATRAREEFERSPLSVREVARRLSTSAAQVYRVIDPARASTSLDAVIALLHVLGCRVDVAVTPRAAVGRRGDQPSGISRVATIGR